MDRPTSIENLSAEKFLAYYWLKADLVAYCRQHGLPTSGAKQELTQRIAHFLATGEVKEPETKKKRGSGKMPSTFTPESIIGSNWRCSQDLRRFFEAEIGPSFHFNQFLRSYINEDGVGQTLQTAIDGWHQSKAAPAGSSEIAPQFEYNRHVREFFKNNPNATRQDAIDAWNQLKSQPKS